MKSRNSKKGIFGFALAIAVATAAILPGNLTAQGMQPGANAAAPGAASAPQAAGQTDQQSAILHVGTYDPQTTFEQHPGFAKLMETVGTMQADAQQAQMEGDEQKMQQLQMQFEQQRLQVMEKFQQDLNEALPQAAEAANVQIIVTEVAYSAGNVKTTDVTAQLVEILAKTAGQQEEEGAQRASSPESMMQEPQQPGMPGEQQPHQSMQPQEQPGTPKQ